MPKRASPPVEHGERRKFYRRPHPRAHELSVGVVVRKGEVRMGEMVDLSIRGTGAKFVTEQQTDLAPGNRVLVRISAAGREEKIETAARVVFQLEPRGSTARFGFEFTDSEGLQLQLSDFFRRVFNRRRAMRARPPFNALIPTSIWWGGQDFEGSLVELSTDGASLHVARETAEALPLKSLIWVRFQLPGIERELGGSCHVVRRSHTPGGPSTLGVNFDMKQPKGWAETSPALTRWVLERSEDSARWNARA
jgi:hypothetical protein